MKQITKTFLLVTKTVNGIGTSDDKNKEISVPWCGRFEVKLYNNESINDACELIYKSLVNDFKRYNPFLSINGFSYRYDDKLWEFHASTKTSIRIKDDGK